MENLKVGQSFEVVEVLDPNEYKLAINLFKKRGHTLSSGNLCLINGSSGLFEGKNQFLYLDKTRRKPIGKLTIKSLKQC